MHDLVLLCKRACMIASTRKNMAPSTACFALNSAARRAGAEQVEEAQVQCSDDQRDELLYYLVACLSGRTLVFANAISAVRRLAAILRQLQMACGVLHAGMQQRQRLKALDRFRAAPDGVLLATDVAARGIDVQACAVYWKPPFSRSLSPSLRHWAV